MTSVSLSNIFEKIHHLIADVVPVVNSFSMEKVFSFLYKREDCIKSHNHQFYIQPLSDKVLSSALH